MFFTAAAALLAALVQAIGGAAAAAPPFFPPDSLSRTSRPAISRMSLEIWPEYDDPRVLVIYRGKLAPSVEIPADLSFLVPRGAQIHMAGAIDANGAHLHYDYETQPGDGGLDEVSYTLQVPDFYMEFYFDPFTGGEDHAFTYPLVAPGDVGSLTMAVQEPLRAEAFEVSPAPRTTELGQDGFRYHLIEQGPVPAGRSVPVSVTYRKSDYQPSAVAQQIAETERAMATGSWRGRLRMFFPGLVTVLLLGVVTYGLVLRWHHLAPAGVREGKEGWAGEGNSGPSDDPGFRSWRFCTHCGEPLEPEDRFCGRCGHPSRLAPGFEPWRF